MRHYSSCRLLVNLFVAAQVIVFAYVPRAYTTQSELAEKIEAFMHQPVSDSPGIDDIYSDVYCSDNIETFLYHPLRPLDYLMPEYGLTMQKYQAMLERCDPIYHPSSSPPSLYVARSSNDLICIIAVANRFELPSDKLVIILPEQDYTLYQVFTLSGKVRDVTFCGVADLLNHPDDDQLDTEYQINGRSVNIPPREWLTRLHPVEKKTDPDTGRVYKYASLWRIKNSSTFSLRGLSIDATHLQSLNLLKKYQNGAVNVHKTYIRNAMVIAAISATLRSSKIEIDNSIFENLSGTRALLVEDPELVDIKNTVFNNIAPPYRWSEKPLPAIDVHGLDSPQSMILLQSLKFSSSGWKYNTPLYISGGDKPIKLLIQDVEFAEGITLPLSSSFTFNGQRQALPEMMAGSTNNTWYQPTGNKAHTGCADGVYSGVLEFHNGIRCTSNDDE